MRKIRINQLVFVALGAALITVCSYISVPATVPFTLQTFAIFLIAAVFPVTWSLATVLVYTLLGVIGLPVFAGFKNGAAALVSPTAGYIFGFFFIALCVGISIRIFGRRYVPMIVSMFAGLIICYAFGTAWFWFAYSGNAYDSIGAVISVCVLPFIVPDIIKIFLAVFLAKRIGNVYDRMCRN